ncbi:hypothetical protein Egran_03633, partial [Elaphomyces granulatus]
PAPRPNCTPKFDVFRESDPILFNSPSPLRPEAWQRLLSSYPGDLPILLVGILTHGARLGYEGPKQLIISRNLPIELSDYEVLDSKTAADLGASLITQTMPEYPCIISPLGVVPKGDGGRRRIHHLSHPEGESVNDFIPPEYASISYVTFDAWWNDLLDTFNGVRLIDDVARPTARIYTDACDDGLGAFALKGGTLTPDFAFSFRPNSRLRAKHINVKEVAAVAHSLKRWGAALRGHAICIYTDSTTVLSGIRRGFLHGPPMVPLRQLLLEAARFDINLTCEWIPGRENGLADALSRANESFIANFYPVLLQIPPFAKRRGTSAVYTTAVKAYVLLCRLRLLNPWPATEESLIVYACTRAQGCSLLNLNSLAPKTISGHISALRSYHVDHGLSCAVFESERLRRVLQGITACFNEPNARLRHPLTRDILRAMLRVRVAYPSRHAQVDDLNFRTALKVAYAGFLRLGEITFNPADATDPRVFQRYHILRKDVRVNRDHATLHLRNSKADRNKQGVYICVARTGDSLCPVTALEQLFSVDNQPSEAPLFRFVNRGFR